MKNIIKSFNFLLLFCIIFVSFYLIIAHLLEPIKASIIPIAFASDVTNKSNSTNMSEMQTYENKLMGIKLKYPKSWVLGGSTSISECIDENRCFFSLIYNDDKKGMPLEWKNIHINVDRKSEFIEKCNCETLLEYVRYFYQKTITEQTGPLIQYVSDNQTTIANNTAWNMVMDVDFYNRNDMRELTLLTKTKDGILYTIKYEAGKNEYSNFLPQVQQIINSIEFIPIEEHKSSLPTRPSFMQALDPEKSNQESDLLFNNKSETTTLENQKLNSQRDLGKENELKILSYDSYINSIGHFHVVGEIQNNTPNVAKFVKVIGTFYDINGKVVGTSSTYTDPFDLPPGEKTPFDLILTDSTVPAQQITNYSLKVTWS